MLEYKLNKNEGEMLKDVIEKVMSKYSDTFMEFGEYDFVLYFYNRLDDDVIEFRDKDILRGVINALSSIMSHTDLFSYSQDLIFVDNTISRICIDLYSLL